MCLRSASAISRILRRPLISTAAVPVVPRPCVAFGHRLALKWFLIKKRKKYLPNCWVLNPNAGVSPLLGHFLNPFSRFFCFPTHTVTSDLKSWFSIDLCPFTMQFLASAVIQMKFSNASFFFHVVRSQIHCECAWNRCGNKLLRNI